MEPPQAKVMPDKELLDELRKVAAIWFSDQYILMLEELIARYETALADLKDRE